MPPDHDEPQHRDQAALRESIDGLADQSNVDADDLLIQGRCRDPMYRGHRQPHESEWFARLWNDDVDQCERTVSTFGGPLLRLHIGYGR